MKINFFNWLEAIGWIAKYSEDEGQFEVLREQLTFNEIYSGKYYLILEEKRREVVLLAAK